MDLKHRELPSFISKAHQTRLSLFIHGTVGIGKSQIVAETAQKLAAKVGRKFVNWNEVGMEFKRNLINYNMHECPEGADKAEWNAKRKEYSIENFWLFSDLRISQMDPADIRGLPDFTDIRECVEWKPTMVFAAMAITGCHGTLFLDEMNLAAPSVQAAAYQIIRDRCIGEICLSQDVGVIAAGNSGNDRASVFEMSAPLKNRFLHCNLLPPTIEAYTEYAVSRDLDARIIGFLNFNPGLMMADIKKISDKDGDAFPTPRTWEMVSRMITGEKDADLIAKYAATAIGDGASKEFKAFVKMNCDLSIKDLIEKPEFFIKKYSKDLQMIWVMLSAVTEYFRNDPKKNMKASLGVIVALKDNNMADFSISLMKMIFCGKNRTDLFKVLVASKEYAPILADMSKFAPLSDDV